jgi:hypothetical protein
MTTTFEPIEKEKIEALKFPAQDVLIDKEQIKERESELNRALALGNLEHTKIKIYFEDDQSLKLVETTVWGVTDKRVILKKGVVIPINSPLCKHRPFYYQIILLFQVKLHVLFYIVFFQTWQLLQV